MKRRPTIARLREVLAYDPETGRLTWRVAINSRAPAGSEVSCRDKDGYIRLKLDGVYLRAHRVIWAMVKGRWPKIDIDHEDRDHANNRWLNLREANKTQNRANSKLLNTNTSGLKGVTWVKSRRKWQAQISVKRKHIHLGRFDTPEAAHAAYAAAAKKHFGEFARMA